MLLQHLNGAAFHVRPHLPFQFKRISASKPDEPFFFRSNWFVLVSAEVEIDALLNLRDWDSTEMVTVFQKCPRRLYLKGPPLGVVDPAIEKKNGGCLPLSPGSDLVLVRSVSPSLLRVRTVHSACEGSAGVVFSF